jgi:hypothetical protein
MADRRARWLGPMRDLDDAGLKREVGEAYSQLAQKLGSLTDEQALWKPDKEEWSAAQIGDHLSLSMGTLGNITGLLAKGQSVSDADWDPPPQFRGDVSDLSNVKKRVGELAAFSATLFDEGAKINNLDVKANNSFLGDMNWREWFYFLGIHAKSHIEQIDKLRGTDGFPS